MRREEAEQEAAWRNADDERRARLEFYAFDASAGLADDAWEVTMRLRREPARATALAVTQPVPEPRPQPAPAFEPWEPPPEPEPEPEPEPAIDLAPEPPRGFLGGLVRVVGTAVILVAVLWVGMIVALAVLIHVRSVTGLAIYAAGALVGLAAIGLGVVIRRS